MTYYTAEKFAKRAGVTSRTLRYYDKIGLLKPSKYTECGYRLYCDDDMIRLQRIIALRYLRFSLPEIQLTLEKDEADGVLDSLRSQREAFEKERAHLDHIIETIKRLEETKDCGWQDLTRLIQMINSDEEIQWRFVESWRKERDDLFESKKSNPEGWRQFVFRQLAISEADKVLELDTNDGALWRRNADQLPGCHITQTVLDQAAYENLVNKMAAVIWTNAPSFFLQDPACRKVSSDTGRLRCSGCQSSVYPQRGDPSGIGGMQKIAEKRRSFLLYGSWEKLYAGTDRTGAGL